MKNPIFRTGRVMITDWSKFYREAEDSNISEEQLAQFRERFVYPDGSLECEINFTIFTAKLISKTED